MREMNEGKAETGVSGGAESAGAGTARWLGCPVPAWARRLGAAAFLFFLIKGLLWLTVPALLVLWRTVWAG